MPNTFRLTDSFIDGYRNKQPSWGFGVVGWITYKRTYARPKPEGGIEDWYETVRRVVEGCYRAQQRHCQLYNMPWNGQKAQFSAQKMYALIFEMKFLPPGRGLWAMGTDYVEERGSAALNNCGFISTADISTDFSYPFTFLMDMSMLGVGVGGDTTGAGKFTPKKPATTEEPFIIPDSREGWVKSVRILLDAFAGKGALPPFDYSQIRPAGSLLRGFGGYASGPEPLQHLHEQLITMLTAGIGEPITSTLIVDIFNLIGQCVVAGGIRRSAEIMLGEPSDSDFRRLKDPELWPEQVNSHRWASNNSIIADLGMDYDDYLDQIANHGEPGFFWLQNARSYGRMGDPAGEHDPFVAGCNPCGEQSLESGELCNLVEVFPAKHTSVDDFINTLKYAYLYAKTVTLIPTHNAKVNAIVGRNRRIGTSVSGITQAIMKFGYHNFLSMLDKGYNYLRELDKMYSRWLCVPNSIKLTSVKPSGTISLLAGSTPGIHFPESRYYIRNIRFDKWTPLLDLLKDAGYTLEKSSNGDHTTIASFPVRQEMFNKAKPDVSVWEQFGLAAALQRVWSDNQVSVTITFQEHEVKDVARCLTMFEGQLKSVALLPLNSHGYKQAPYIPIEKEKYDTMMMDLKPIDFSEGQVEMHDTEDKFSEADGPCAV